MKEREGRVSEIRETQEMEGREKKRGRGEEEEECVVVSLK